MSELAATGAGLVRGVQGADAAQRLRQGGEIEPEPLALGAVASRGSCPSSPWGIEPQFGSAALPHRGNMPAGTACSHQASRSPKDGADTTAGFWGWGAWGGGGGCREGPSGADPPLRPARLFPCPSNGSPNHQPEPPAPLADVSHTSELVFVVRTVHGSGTGLRGWSGAAFVGGALCWGAHGPSFTSRGVQLLRDSSFATR